MFAHAKLLFGRSASPARVSALLAVVLAISSGVVGWMALRPSPTAAGSAAVRALDPGEPPQVLVFVSGAVSRPGLYELASSARIADAIAAAGGLTRDADPGRLPNLAARIHDGRQVNVPFLRTGAARTATERVDVNSATLDELRDVPGMPYGLAEAIIDYRERFGPYRSLTDLRRLLALDAGVLTGLRPYLRVVPPAP